MNSQKIKIFLESFILLFLLAFLIFLGRDKMAAFYYNRGVALYDTGSYREAIKAFNNSLKFSPSMSKIHYTLANAFYADNQEVMAIEEYKEAIKLEPGFLWPYESLSELYLKRGDYAKADALLKEAEKNIKDKDKIRELSSLNSFKQATALINRGIDAFLSGDKNKGYDLLGQALKINPDFVLTRYSLGYFYYKDRRYDEALEMLEKASQLDSNFMFTHKLLADIFYSKNNFSRAIEEYKKALSSNEQDSVILNNLGLCFMNLEEYDKAIEFLQRAVKLEPRNLNLRYSLASLYRDAGRAQESILEYKKIIEYKFDFPNIYNDLADIEKASGHHKEALEQYKNEADLCEKKLLSFPDDLELLNNLAYAYNGLGQYGKAKDIIEQVLVAKPDYREALLTLASIQRNQGNYEESLASLEKAKKLSTQRQFFIEQKIGDLKKEFEISTGKKRPQDTVFLKNGRHFQGNIIVETQDKLVMEINIGNSLGNIVLLRSDIERIAKDK